MINISRYINNPDVKELHINPANIDMLSVTKMIIGMEKGKEGDEAKEIPIYDDNYSRVKMIISSTPLELIMPNSELDEFLTSYSLERGK